MRLEKGSCILGGDTHNFYSKINFQMPKVKRSYMSLEGLVQGHLEGGLSLHEDMMDQNEVKCS